MHWRKIKMWSSKTVGRIIMVRGLDIGISDLQSKADRLDLLMTGRPCFQTNSLALWGKVNGFGPGTNMLDQSLILKFRSLIKFWEITLFLLNLKITENTFLESLSHTHGITFWITYTHITHTLSIWVSKRCIWTDATVRGGGYRQLWPFTMVAMVPNRHLSS